MTVTATCVNGTGHPKKAYPSERSAKRELARNPRWLLRSSRPVPYRCGACHMVHLGHPRVEQ